MSDEELRRVMEFIIKRQESFAEGMELMREEARQRQAEAEERFKELERASLNLYNAMAELTSAHGVLARKMVELAEAQAHTDRRVDALIDFLTRRRDEKDEE